jgi:hypothetical protein
MDPERARDLFAFDAAELLLMSRPLAEVLRRVSDDRATLPPPARQA